MKRPRLLWPALTVTAFVALATLSLHAQGISSKDLLDGFANPSRWLTYSGDYSGRRHSPLTQITPSNASQLAAQWTFQTGVAGQVRGNADRARRHPLHHRPAESCVGD